MTENLGITEPNTEMKFPNIIDGKTTVINKENSNISGDLGSDSEDEFLDDLIEWVDEWDLSAVQQKSTFAANVNAEKQVDKLKTCDIKREPPNVGNETQSPGDECFERLSTDNIQPTAEETFGSDEKCENKAESHSKAGKNLRASFAKVVWDESLIEKSTGPNTYKENTDVDTTGVPVLQNGKLEKLEHKKQKSTEEVDKFTHSKNKSDTSKSQQNNLDVSLKEPVNDQLESNVVGKRRIAHIPKNQQNNSDVSLKKSVNDKVKDIDTRITRSKNYEAHKNQQKYVGSKKPINDKSEQVDKRTTRSRDLKNQQNNLDASLKKPVNDKLKKVGNRTSSRNYNEAPKNQNDFHVSLRKPVNDKLKEVYKPSTSSRNYYEASKNRRKNNLHVDSNKPISDKLESNKVSWKGESSNVIEKETVILNIEKDRSATLEKCVDKKSNSELEEATVPQKCSSGPMKNVEKASVTNLDTVSPLRKTNVSSKNDRTNKLVKCNDSSMKKESEDNSDIETIVLTSSDDEDFDKPVHKSNKNKGLGTSLYLDSISMSKKFDTNNLETILPLPGKNADSDNFLDAKRKLIQADLEKLMNAKKKLMEKLENGYSDISGSDMELESDKETVTSETEENTGLEKLVDVKKKIMEELEQCGGNNNRKSEIKSDKSKTASSPSKNAGLEKICNRPKTIEEEYETFCNEIQSIEVNVPITHISTADGSDLEKLGNDKNKIIEEVEKYDTERNKIWDQSTSESCLPIQVKDESLKKLVQNKIKLIKKLEKYDDVNKNYGKEVCTNESDFTPSKNKSSKSPKKRSLDPSSRFAVAGNLDPLKSIQGVITNTDNDLDDSCVGLQTTGLHGTTSNSELDKNLSSEQCPIAAISTSSNTTNCNNSLVVKSSFNNTATDISRNVKGLNSKAGYDSRIRMLLEIEADKHKLMNEMVEKKLEEMRYSSDLSSKFIRKLSTHDEDSKPNVSIIRTNNVESVYYENMKNTNIDVKHFQKTLNFAQTVHCVDKDYKPHKKHKTRDRGKYQNIPDLRKKNHDIRNRSRERITHRSQEELLLDNFVLEEKHSPVHKNTSSSVDHSKDLCIKRRGPNHNPLGMIEANMNTFVYGDGGFDDMFQSPCDQTGNNQGGYDDMFQNPSDLTVDSQSGYDDMFQIPSNDTINNHSNTDGRSYDSGQNRSRSPPKDMHYVNKGDVYKNIKRGSRNRSGDRIRYKRSRRQSRSPHETDIDVLRNRNEQDAESDVRNERTRSRSESESRALALDGNFDIGGNPIGYRSRSNSAENIDGIEYVHRSRSRSGSRIIDQFIDNILNSNRGRSSSSSSSSIRSRSRSGTYESRSDSRSDYESDVKIRDIKQTGSSRSRNKGYARRTRHHHHRSRKSRRDKNFTSSSQSKHSRRNVESNNYENTHFGQGQEVYLSTDEGVRCMPIHHTEIMLDRQPRKYNHSIGEEHFRVKESPSEQTEHWINPYHSNAQENEMHNYPCKIEPYQYDTEEAVREKETYDWPYQNEEHYRSIAKEEYVLDNEIHGELNCREDKPRVHHSNNDYKWEEKHGRPYVRDCDKVPYVVEQQPTLHQSAAKEYILDNQRHKDTYHRGSRSPLGVIDDNINDFVYGNNYDDMLQKPGDNVVHQKCHKDSSHSLFEENVLEDRRKKHWLRSHRTSVEKYKLDDRRREDTYHRGSRSSLGVVDDNINDFVYGNNYGDMFEKPSNNIVQQKCHRSRSHSPAEKYTQDDRRSVDSYNRRSCRPLGVIDDNINDFVYSNNYGDMFRKPGDNVVHQKCNRSRSHSPRSRSHSPTEKYTQDDRRSVHSYNRRSCRPLGVIDDNINDFVYSNNYGDMFRKPGDNVVHQKCNRSRSHSPAEKYTQDDRRNVDSYNRRSCRPLGVIDDNKNDFVYDYNYDMFENPCDSTVHQKRNTSRSSKSHSPAEKYKLDDRRHVDSYNRGSRSPLRLIDDNINDFVYGSNYDDMFRKPGDNVVHKKRHRSRSSRSHSPAEKYRLDDRRRVDSYNRGSGSPLGVIDDNINDFVYGSNYDDMFRKPGDNVVHQKCHRSRSSRSHSPVEKYRLDDRTRVDSYNRRSRTSLGVIDNNINDFVYDYNYDMFENPCDNIVHQKRNTSRSSRSHSPAEKYRLDDRRRVDSYNRGSGSPLGVIDDNINDFVYGSNYDDMFRKPGGNVVHQKRHRSRSSRSHSPADKYRLDDRRHVHSYNRASRSPLGVIDDNINDFVYDNNCDDTFENPSDSTVHQKRHRSRSHSPVEKYRLDDRTCVDSYNRGSRTSLGVIDNNINDFVYDYNYDMFENPCANTVHQKRNTSRSSRSHSPAEKYRLDDRRRVDSYNRRSGSPLGVIDDNINDFVYGSNYDDMFRKPGDNVVHQKRHRSRSSRSHSPAEKYRLDDRRRVHSYNRASRSPLGVIDDNINDFVYDNNCDDTFENPSDSTVHQKRHRSRSHSPAEKYRLDDRRRVTSYNRGSGSPLGVIDDNINDFVYNNKNYDDMFEKSSDNNVHQNSYKSRTITPLTFKENVLAKDWRGEHRLRSRHSSTEKYTLDEQRSKDTYYRRSRSPLEVIDDNINDFVYNNNYDDMFINHSDNSIHQKRHNDEPPYHWECQSQSSTFIGEEKRWGITKNDDSLCQGEHGSQLHGVISDEERLGKGRGDELYIKGHHWRLPNSIAEENNWREDKDNNRYNKEYDETHFSRSDRCTNYEAWENDDRFPDVPFTEHQQRSYPSIKQEEGLNKKSNDRRKHRFKKRNPRSRHATEKDWHNEEADEKEIWYSGKYDESRLRVQSKRPYQSINIDDEWDGVEFDKPRLEDNKYLSNYWKKQKVNPPPQWERQNSKFLCSSTEEIPDDIFPNKKITTSHTSKYWKPNDSTALQSAPSSFNIPPETPVLFDYTVQPQQQFPFPQTYAALQDSILSAVPNQPLNISVNVYNNPTFINYGTPGVSYTPSDHQHT